MISIYCHKLIRSSPKPTKLVHYTRNQSGRRPTQVPNCRPFVERETKCFPSLFSLRERTRKHPTSPPGDQRDRVAGTFGLSGGSSARHALGNFSSFLISFSIQKILSQRLIKSNIKFFKFCFLIVNPSFDNIGFLRSEASILSLCKWVYVF